MAAEIRWSVRHWLNEKQLCYFYFHPSKHDCFELKGPYQHQGNIVKQTSLNKLVVWCQGVIGKCLSVQNNCVAMDENRKVIFIQMNQSFDFSGPIKLTTFRVFIYSKMEHKINKIHRNLYTSGKLRIWQLTRHIYFHNMMITSEYYKSVDDMSFSLVLSYAISLLTCIISNFSKHGSYELVIK